MRFILFNGDIEYKQGNVLEHIEHLQNWEDAPAFVKKSYYLEDLIRIGKDLESYVITDMDYKVYLDETN